MLSKSRGGCRDIADFHSINISAISGSPVILSEIKIYRGDNRDRASGKLEASHFNTLNSPVDISHQDTDQLPSARLIANK